MADLPRIAILNSKNNFKYLRFEKREDGEAGEMDGFLRYSSDAIISPFTKFEIERAQGAAGHAGLIHIKSLYNNKYLARQNADSNFIVAASNETEEDRTKWSCTLFEPIYDSHFEAFRFLHVQLGFYVCLYKIPDEFHNCLYAKSEDPERDHSDFSTIVDWQTICILPKFVAFKKGELFLKAYEHNGSKYLQFGESDVMSNLTGHQVFTRDDGSIRIKSTHWNYWRRKPNWILADDDSDDTAPGGDADTLFIPVKVPGKGNRVALQNLANHKFCRSLTLDGKENCLNASEDTITEDAKLEFHEYAISREIYNVQFKKSDARVYGLKPITMASKNSVNNTTEPVKAVLGMTYEVSNSSTWQATLGITLGVSTSLQTGIPFVAEGKVEIKAELHSEYTWGKTEVKTETVKSEIEVTVPPKSERSVSIVAKRGQCDVPFSYTQKDYLPDGKSFTYQKDDGIYSGLNYYKFEDVIDDPRAISN